MLSNRMQDALNKQINAELYSSYLYLSMACYFKSMSLSGCSNWMQHQSQEEYGHAMKFLGYIEDRRGKVYLQPIDQPQLEWTSPLEVFEAAFKHEQKVTKMINDLVALAGTDKDYATHNFLEWFVEEQVEEEASADQIVNQLRMIGKDPAAMYLLDRELGNRGKKD